MEGPKSAQWAFLSSLLTYPALHLTFLPTALSFPRIVQSREAISLLHCTLQTLLSVACLRQHRDAFDSPNAEEGNRSPSSPPIITTRSSFASCITAIEAGYLLQDSLLLVQAYLERKRTTPRSAQLKSWSILHLGLHHAGFGTLLLLLQFYIAKGREKGILVIVALHLMNVPSIFGTLRWFLINFRANRQQLIFLTTAMYLTTFAVFRVYLIVWIVRAYARQLELSTWAAVMGLPSPCKIGTSIIMVVNSIWLVYNIKKLTLRLMS